MVEVIPVETTTLGDCSYVAHDGEVAVVVDPQRDTDRIEELVDSLGVSVAHVFETHIHNDYVTGGRALASSHGARYHVNASDPVDFPRDPVEDGTEVRVSDEVCLRALATPGHTFTHLSYVLSEAGRPVAVFTGGSLLYGSTGRPDLLGAEATGALARAQHRSARLLCELLPGETEIFPTHGFGSFCAASPTEGTSSTIEQERLRNPALTRDEEAFVAEVLSGLDAYPAYYARMGPANLSAPAGRPDLSVPRLASVDEVLLRIRRGEWVVDLRTRTAFAGGHLRRTLNFPLEGPFATYLGWLIPPGTPLTLLGETPGELAEARRELVRIGIERVAAGAVGGLAGWLAELDGEQVPYVSTTRVTSFAGLAERIRTGEPTTVVDVSLRSEWEASHIDRAVHVPLFELPDRLHELPEGELYVHCRSGYRSSVAASLLENLGREGVVTVDGDYDLEAGAAGLELVARRT